MFYQKEHSKTLRLGDIVEGFISTRPTMERPNPLPSKNKVGIIEIELPAYSVVLSPCCSIDSGTICLTPLIEINNKIFKSVYLREDPTRLNKTLRPELAIPSDVWNRTDFKEKKEQLLVKGPGYVFDDYFVYEQNELFTEYTVNMKNESNIKTNYYMIDFRKIYSLMCNMIKREGDLKEEDKPLIQSKRLELSVESRKVLREKLSYFFGRAAPEDLALINSDS